VSRRPAGERKRRSEYSGPGRHPRRRCDIFDTTPLVIGAGQRDGWTKAWFGRRLAKSGDAHPVRASAAQLRRVDRHCAELVALQENP
jgi:hypothetical protein